jgi:hypothetical protein
LASTGNYTSAAEVFAAVEGLEHDVDARLQAIAAVMPRAGAFGSSVRRDRERHRRERDELRRRLGLGPAPQPPPPPEADASLAGLRQTQQELVHAHAEGLPALGDARAVDRLAAHMVDLARQLTVIDLWLELEDQDG